MFITLLTRCNTGACTGGSVVVTTVAPVVTTAPVIVVTTPQPNCLTTCLNGGTLQGCTCLCFPPYSGKNNILSYFLREVMPFKILFQTI